MSETGSVKFRVERSSAALAAFPALTELNACRAKLRQRGLLGVDANGIGFGNISVRDGMSTRFFITGSGTGGKAALTLNDCAKVVACDLPANWLRFEGSAMASSESLTHAVIYETDDSVRAIIHCHSLTLWTALLAWAPATPAATEYGTPEMARAVQNLFRITDVRRTRVFAMAGHREGVVAFGHDLAHAYAALGPAPGAGLLPSSELQTRSSEDLL